MLIGKGGGGHLSCFRRKLPLLPGLRASTPRTFRLALRVGGRKKKKKKGTRKKESPPDRFFVSSSSNSAPTLTNSPSRRKGEKGEEKKKKLSYRIGFEPDRNASQNLAIHR